MKDRSRETAPSPSALGEGWGEGFSMGYVKFSDAPEIDPAIVEALAILLGLEIPHESIPELGDAVRGQLASVQSLEELNLTDIMPALEFDPRWES
jgi:hypothetical protein